MTNRRAGFLVWAGAALLYLGLALPRIGQPVAGDEVMVLRHGERFTGPGGPAAGLNQAMGVSQPLIYVYLAGWAGRISGDPVLGARILGMASALGILALVVWWARRGGGVRAATTAGLLAAVNPVFVQGSLLVVYDTAVLTCGLLAWAALAWRSRWFASRPAALGGAGILALLLGLQIGTPCLLVAAALVCGGREGGRAALGRIGLVGAAGAGLFVCGWIWYCGVTEQAIGFPFTRVGTLWEVVHLRSLSELSRRLTVASLWATPAWTLAVVLAVRWRLAQARGGAWDLPLVFSGVLVGASGVLGLLAYNFPRYPAPAIPALCLGIGGWVAAAAWRWRRFSGGVAAAVAAAIFVGDPLYRVVYEARNEAISGIETHSSLVRRGATELLLGLVPSVAGTLALRTPAGIAVGAIGAGLGLSGRQAAADYQTGYTYGIRGTRSAALVVQRAIAGGGIALAPSELLYYAGDRRSPYEARVFLTSREAFLAEIRKPAVRLVGYSRSTQSAWQIREIFRHPEAEAALRRGFHRTIVGDFVLWERRGAA